MAHVCDRAAIGDDDRRCEFCSKLFIQRKNMLQHIRNVHKMAVDVKKLMKCDVCGTSLPTMEKYSVHQIAAHNFEADYVHLVFRNNKEFHEWKVEEEGSQNCWFILPRDPKKLASGETRIHYYCNRSGEARKKEGHSDRWEKSQGSCRSGKICLSFITVTITVRHLKAPP
ncbi:uncharacterized protein LOC142576714 isoform X1 [Dermacentor variabilis]|uniref:uncharacterized protein LOC142576714 isoform X1 n=1 Tax=Dermacentor variabilis TaxID=34621 RepID=UPI003F5C8545